MDTDLVKKKKDILFVSGHFGFIVDSLKHYALNIIRQYLFLVSSCYLVKQFKYCQSTALYNTKKYILKKDIRRNDRRHI